MSVIDFEKFLAVLHEDARLRQFIAPLRGRDPRAAVLVLATRLADCYEGKIPHPAYELLERLG
jgi:hypothetical protein